MFLDTSKNALPLDEDTFHTATLWHLASRILYAYMQAGAAIPPFLGIPSFEKHGAVPLLAVAGPSEALALELYFKAGLFAERKQPKKTHTLTSLFRCLNTGLRRDIERRYAAWQGDNPGWGTWWAQQGQSVAFADLLAESSEAFEQFRYIAEHTRHAKSPIRTFKFVAMPITDATRDALASKYPTWEPHAAKYRAHTTFRTP